MPIMPGALWEPVSGHTDGPMRSYTGIVLHCNDAESYDLRGFIQSSSGESAVSCHFQVAKDGTIWQYIDTKNDSWCQSDGNPDYLSIESEGKAGEYATPAQVASIGKILRWVHVTHGIPLQLAERPGQQGFGWHGMGAAAGANWGHSACPGVRRTQRQAMIDAANALQLESGGATQLGTTTTSPQEGNDMPIAIYNKTASNQVYLIFGNTAIAVTDNDTTKAFRDDPKHPVPFYGLPNGDFNRIAGALRPNQETEGAAEVVSELRAEHATFPPQPAVGVVPVNH